MLACDESKTRSNRLASPTIIAVTACDYPELSNDETRAMRSITALGGSDVHSNESGFQASRLSVSAVAIAMVICMRTTHE
jgi:hypothetical protein